MLASYPNVKPQEREPMAITELPMRFDESDDEHAESALKSRGAPQSALKRNARALSSKVDDVIFEKSRPGSKSEQQAPARLNIAIADSDRRKSRLNSTLSGDSATQNPAEATNEHHFATIVASTPVENTFHIHKAIRDLNRQITQDGQVLETLISDRKQEESKQIQDQNSPQPWLGKRRSTSRPASGMR